MNIEEVKNEISTFQEFVHAMCCRCGEDWFCPTICTWLEKASRMDFEKIQKCYTRNDGDIQKIYRYVMRAKI